MPMRIIDLLIEIHMARAMLPH